jgi:hypothetical protein
VKKPISPEEWDRASDYQKRKGAVPATRPTPEIFKRQMLEYARAELKRIGDRALIKQMREIGGWERVIDGARCVHFNANSLSGWSVHKYLDGYYDIDQKRYVSTCRGISDEEFKNIVLQTLERGSYANIPDKLVDAAGNILKRGDECIILPGAVPNRSWNCSKSFGRVANVGGIQKIDYPDHGIRLACWIKPASKEPFVVESDCFEAEQSVLLWLPRQLLMIGGSKEIEHRPSVTEGAL